MSRIIMQLREDTRPLTLGGRGNEAAPLLTSTSRPWFGLPFEMHRLRSVEDVGESGPVDGEVGLMVVTQGNFQTTLRGAHGDRRHASRRGTIHILSGNERPHVLSIEGRAEVMAVKLDATWLDYLPVAPRNIGRTVPFFGGRTAQALATAMLEEVTGGCGAGRLYAESLSMALLSYTFNRMATLDGVPVGARLSPAEQRRVIRFVHDNLDRNIGIETLATLLRMTPRQFATRFRNAFGTTPHRYVTATRLRKGANLLAAGRHDIADIALRIGFSSQSHFTTAFRRAFGETPRRYTKRRFATR